MKSLQKFSVQAVSYLNTVPLIWGMQHGKQAAEVDLLLSIPSECARDIESGKSQVGLVPIAEIARQGLEIVPGLGITCRGAVRSILLFSRVPWNKIRTLAADLSSRTSVELAAVILREQYGVSPSVTREKPALNEMLTHADAALVIGDPALRLDPEGGPYRCKDLGQEWFNLTGLPFVFAAWAGKPGLPVDALGSLFRASYDFSRSHLSEIIEHEYTPRGISAELTARYLTHYIRYPIGPEEERGMHAFLELAGLPRPLVAERA